MSTEFDNYLANKFGIRFHNEALLDAAFTQASYVNEHPGRHLKYYQRLEFLGDAVYELVVSTYIFKHYPTLPEGRLTRLRAAMVDQQSFSKLAKECHFDKHILLGKGEEKAHARNRVKLLCDIFESFIAAVYIDQGMKPVVRFCNQVIFPKLGQGWFDEYFDHKTDLQERVQEHGPVKIQYHVLDANGPDNKRKFKVSVTINNKQLGIGVGHSKKNAEQHAAKKALEVIDKNN
ncbi:ribonuclease III [Acetilactobacillus jinshanensis]|uniref:ribonuclease III n=1 Tax=Acetilactobacillus jinshanensis TaxID=1720083 RepID=UPI003CE57426